MATVVVEEAAMAAVEVEAAMVEVEVEVEAAVEVDGAEVLAGSQSQPPSDAAEEIYWSPPPYGR